MCVATLNEGDFEMTHDSELVVQGYLSLSAEEQREVDEVLKGLRNADSVEKRAVAYRMIKAAHPRLSMGPVRAGCPCCSR